MSPYLAGNPLEQTRTDDAYPAYRCPGTAEVQRSRYLDVLKERAVLTGVTTTDYQVGVRHVRGTHARHGLEHAEDVFQRAGGVTHLLGGQSPEARRLFTVLVEVTCLDEHIQTDVQNPGVELESHCRGGFVLDFDVVHGRDLVSHH